MSYVTPPADFDTRYATGDIDGALAPLHSVNTSIGIFNDLGAQITLVSTDGTAAANSDTQLMTMKAIKTLGASGGIVTAPLVLTSNTAYQLACKQTGHLGGVTMGYTVGDVCELDCTDPIIVTNAANALSPTTGGALQVKGGISTAKTVWGANLGAANNDGNPQLQVFFDPTHSADFRCTAAGALHLNSSGGITDRTALRDFDDLVAKGVLERVGKTGRSAYYVLRQETRHKPDKPDISETRHKPDKPVSKGARRRTKGHLSAPASPRTTP